MFRENTECPSKSCMKVISVEREFWRDVRNAENSGEMCSVEYEMKISWPVRVQNFLMS